MLPLAQLLADQGTVVLPDLRGHGRSHCPDPARHTWARYTDDLVRLLDHLDIARAVLVGAGPGSRRSRTRTGSRPRC
ncbi:alpha/beta fold hydrolase [Streptomyces sp. NPDC052040]|uniref:alpha/beta fold hydrolase n=1 Tax=unclassified Streptomyces TaxID=2593676 RepID=UPI0037CD2316